MNRYYGKPDTTQKAIVAALEARGATILNMTSLGRGAPDLCLGWAGKNYLVEVKTKTGKANVLQLKWWSSWRGQKPIVMRSIDDVNTFFDSVR